MANCLSFEHSISLVLQSNPLQFGGQPANNTDRPRFTGTSQPIPSPYERGTPSLRSVTQTEPFLKDVDDNFFDSAVESWSRLLDLQDKETEEHSKRVTEMTVRLARAAGLDDEQVCFAKWGAMLHDIGKIGVPDAILRKPGPLTEEEWEIMRRHPVTAHKMLAPIPFLGPAVDIPHFHHERWDGAGYPYGLKGDEIPIATRLFAVVDVYDALRSDRPYRKAWTEAQVREHLLAQSGTHFDPRAVQIFIDLLEEPKSAQAVVCDLQLDELPPYTAALAAVRIQEAAP